MSELSLRSRLEAKTARIAVIGQGYVGHRAFDYGLVAREAPLVIDTRHAIVRAARHP